LSLGARSIASSLPLVDEPGRRQVMPLQAPQQTVVYVVHVRLVVKKAKTRQVVEGQDDLAGSSPRTGASTPTATRAQSKASNSHARGHRTARFMPYSPKKGGTQTRGPWRAQWPKPCLSSQPALPARHRGPAGDASMARLQRRFAGRAGGGPRSNGRKRLGAPRGGRRRPMGAASQARERAG
jgi:hypothetical protein